MAWSKALPPAVSRRSFLHLAGMAAAAAPILTEGHLAYAALRPEALQQADPKISAVADLRPHDPVIPADAVLINANENPLGPCASAVAAIGAIACKGGRYDSGGETQKLTELFAQQNNLTQDHIAVYAGSSEPLHFSVMAFTSPIKGYVTADPSYEAGMVAAASSRARISRVALRADYAHDLKAMVAADSHAGLLYICNPNNPTGTVTALEDIEWALEHKPKGSILLVDEAYIHLSDTKSALPLVAQGKDLIVLRTFSKIYGMAGIRCGIACGRPDLLARLQPFGMNAMPITGSIAGRMSLLDADLIPTRKALIASTRSDTFAFLQANGWTHTPSESNCFMIDTGRSGRGVIAAMRERKVYIGRTWPVWPNAVRVSVGTPEEMAKFQTAFKEVMAMPAGVA